MKIEFITAVFTGSEVITSIWPTVLAMQTTLKEQHTLNIIFNLELETEYNDECCTWRNSNTPSPNKNCTNSKNNVLITTYTGYWLKWNRISFEKIYSKWVTLDKNMHMGSLRCVYEKYEVGAGRCLVFLHTTMPIHLKLSIVNLYCHQCEVVGSCHVVEYLCLKLSDHDCVYVAYYCLFWSLKTSIIIVLLSKLNFHIFLQI